MRHFQVDFWEGKYLVQNVEVREGKRRTMMQEIERRPLVQEK